MSVLSNNFNYMTEFDLLVQKTWITGFTSLYDLYFVLLLNSHPCLASGARSCGILRLVVFCLRLEVVITMG